jgi:hypothetical protein
MPQPSLDELMSRFLAAKAPRTEADAGEVEPHEVAGGFRAAATVTWAEAVAVFRHFGVEAEKVACPPEWAAFTALDTAVVAVPLAAGLFPQRVRQVPSLLAMTDLSTARPTDGPAVPGFTSLRGWVRKALASRSPATLLIASGVAAGLGDWDDAELALTAAEPLCGGAWRTVWLNQVATIRWLRGDDTSVEAWTSLGRAAAFNRGVAALFAGKAGIAEALFHEAATTFPETSGWNHLAELYLVLARTRMDN